jgi:hypothetical protein
MAGEKGVAGMVPPGPVPGGGGGVPGGVGGAPVGAGGAPGGGGGGEPGGGAPVGDPVPMGPKPPRPKPRKVVNGGDVNIPVGGVEVGPGVNMGFIVDPSGFVPPDMVTVSRRVVVVANWGS